MSHKLYRPKSISDLRGKLNECSIKIYHLRLYPNLNHLNTQPMITGRNVNDNKYRDIYDNYGDQTFYIIGDRVLVDGYREASVAFFGELDFSSGDWVGVVLDEPTGNHDGKIHGREYFHCAPRHGLFVRPTRITRISAEDSTRSTPASYQTIPSGRSTQDSYYYDDDYRASKSGPTVESLSRKLRSLETRASAGNLGPSSRSEPRLNGILKTGGSVKLDTRTWRTEEPSSVFNFRPKRKQLHEYEYQRPPTPRYSTTTTSAFNMSDNFPNIGDRVSVRSERGQLSGVLRFLGETNFATGEWAGVELDEAYGKNDGTVLGCRYFECHKDHGLFVPSTRVTKEPEQEFKFVRSTIKSPPPISFVGRTSATPNNYSYDSYQSSSSSYSASPNISLSPYADSITQSPAPSLGERYSSLDSERNTGNRGLGNKSRSPYRETSLGSPKPKFKESDLDAQLRDYIGKPKESNRYSYSYSKRDDKPKSIVYTFRSSKYDGNPIALRSVQYDRETSPRFRH